MLYFTYHSEADTASFLHSSLALIDGLVTVLGDVFQGID